MPNINSTTNMYGNLNVNGDNVELNVNELSIKDNIITINSGENADKVSKNKAGIEIDRGSSNKYQIIYDEEDSKLKIGLENSLDNVATETYVNSYVKDNFFELDSDGNYMPTEYPISSPSFELDENGDIMLKEDEQE